MKSKKGCILSILLVLFIFGVTIPLFMTNHKKIKADTINNLTNTTWILNNDFTTPNEMYFYLEGNVTASQWGSNSNVSYTFYEDINQGISNFVVGAYYDDLESEYYTSSNTLDFRVNYQNTDIHTILNRNNTNFSNLQIEITGGEVTNQYLISWLQDNATQQQPAPDGTEITHRYWATYRDIIMLDNQSVYDEEITYTILFNEYDNDYENQTLTGLTFYGIHTNPQVNNSYILSVNNNGRDTLYQGDTNRIDNTMWLEFRIGDYMDDDLYNFMTSNGVWFDDANIYIAGANQGYIEGTEHGIALGQADAIEYTSLITNIFNGIGNILSIQIFPNITIGLIIGLPLLLGVLIIILKILRG